MGSPSKSGESSSSSSSWKGKSAGGPSSTFLSNYVGDKGSEKDWRKPKLAVAVSSSDGSRSPKPNVRNLSPKITKAPKVFHHGAVLNVNYERCFGLLTPLPWAASSLKVYFRVENPMASSATLTGGMRLIPGDTMEYELANRSTSDETPRARAHLARLRECKTRDVTQLERYVDSLVTAAKEDPEIVVRVITKCSVAFKLVLDYRAPSKELIRHTLELCEVLSCASGLYNSRLKQIYALFAGSHFLTSQHGVRTWAKHLSSSDQRFSELLQGFVTRLLEFTPSQLPSIAPLILSRIPGQSDVVSNLSADLDHVLPLLHAEGKAYVAKALEALILSDGAETFFRTILGVLAGGSGCKEIPWSSIPLLPTVEEVQTLHPSTRSTLPVVKQKGPYNSSEEYLDTYLRLLREDCFAGLLQGIHNLVQGKPKDCELKLWINVSACGVHFDYNVSPGLLLAVTLLTSQRKAPMSGSLVCFFDDVGGFEYPIWGVVSRCEDDAPNKCTICFVDIVILRTGTETTSRGSNPWCFQCARLMQCEAMVMAESPTYYRAYQPVLETLQLTDPESIPFRQELVSTTWPQDPAPEYLKSTDETVTLDWSCIFEDKLEVKMGLLQQLQLRYMGAEVGAMRTGVGAMASLLDRGYKTSFDSSQLKAVELAVHNRLAMIQGPPGTGKTYVAVKLLQLLLSASTFPEDGLVLIITLKNHALDQILERCLAFEKNLVRVGGRSNSKILEPLNLNQKTKTDEFRFDCAENIQKLSILKDELKNLFDHVNRCLVDFDPSMIVKHASELHLNHFLERAVQPGALIESCARKLPESFTLVDLIRGQIPDDADPTSVAVAQGFRERLLAEMKRWLPSPEVLQSAIAFLSLTKPVSSRIPQCDDVSAENLALPDEEDESRKEEEERRAAIESLRQDITEDLETLSIDSRPSKPSHQWFLSGNFMKFSKEKNLRGASRTYDSLNLGTIGDQFDWLAHENPYDLSAEHRAILVFKFWQESVNEACERLTRVKAEYETLVQDMEQIGERRKLDILRRAKIIGITTTGAAIHQNVLKHLSPALVLVEEAAEVLEPQVLACLNSKLQHLILIGDHQQLRPQVESYDLERWHGFGVSMFERLVEHNKLPSQQLGMQCRMRDEFVAMLRPIYPDLKSQTKLVSGSRNEAPTFMKNTMFFWTHSYPETSKRSFVNQEESLMVVALARWIVSELPNPESLKILAAYNGQVTLIRTLMGKYPELGTVEVRSIDSFQGSECDIAIVSLVRSNEGGKIGHLGMRNRMCVAASRARRGVYFVGNHVTLAQKCAHWRTLINHFEAVQAIDSSIPLCCPRHAARDPFALCMTAASEFEPRNVCVYPCQDVLACGHVCSLTCHAGTHTLRCKVRVDFTFPLCGHSCTKACHQEEEDLLCHKKVMHNFAQCGHNTEKKCWQVTGSRKLPLKCQVVCGKDLECGHSCKLYCSESCESAPCVDCLEIERAKEKVRLQIRLETIAKKKIELEEEILKVKEKGKKGMVVKQVHPDDDTAQSYFMAKDRVEKYTLPGSGVMVVVTKVQKIENLTLQGRFLEAQKELFDPLEIPEWLFYGGSDDLLLGRVVDKGFRAARQMAHRFNVYSSSFAENKSEHHSLLLCEVVLGKTWRLPTSEFLNNNFDGNKLRQKCCDSVSLVGGQENQDESRPFAHVIFNPEQAIPRFLVSYKVVDLQVLATENDFERFGEDLASKSGGVCRLSLLPSTHADLTLEDCHFRVAESQFFRMSKNRAMKVTKVDFIKNVELERLLNRKKQEFEASQISVETQFVFHGTSSDAIDKIVKEGFKIGGDGVTIKNGAVYGHGVYTASDPDTSVAYSRGSNMMLMSTALLGKLDTHHNFGQSRNVLVIKDVCQLLPKYVVYYS